MWREKGGSQRAQSNGARQMIVAAIDRAEAEAVSRAARRGSSASAAPAPFLPDVNTIVTCLEGVVALVDQLGEKDVLRMCAESAGGEGTETCVALIAITNAYRGNKAVANAALAAICRLTARYGDGPDATARRRLGDRGGCEAVTEVLRTHGGDMAIVQRCLECVKYLGREGVNCRRLGDAGACDLVVQAMRSYPRDRGVQLWGCGSVFNLASNTRENKRRLVNLGIAQLLLAAMQAFPRDEEIQENACGAIGNVGDSPGHPELLRSAGVCEQVVLAMRTFPTARRVNLRGVWAVDSLSRDYLPNRDALGNAGACEIVTEALRTFNRDRDLHYWGIGAVKSLASNHPTNKTRLGAAGACEVLVGVLTTQQHDGAVLRAACGAIVALAAKDNPNKERLFAAGAHASLDAIRPRITAEAMAAKRAI